MDFVKWVKDIVYDCALTIIDSSALIADDDCELTEPELAEDIANQVELEINAQRQENKVPPIPMEILRKLDDVILYGAHPETVSYRVPITGTPLAHDIDRICSMPSNAIEELRKSLGISHRKSPLPWDTAPKPVKVWSNPPYTTVEFSDGDKVTVEQDDFEDSKFNEYAGFCCAVTKKLFGSATGAFRRFEAAKKKAVEDSPKFKKVQARKFEKERKAKLREANRATREFKIKQAMEQMRIEQEAKKRLEAEK